MQTSKLFLVVCAFILMVGVLYPRADETEAQKRAREALRQKMQELEGQPQPATPPPPAAPQPPPPQTPQAPPAATPPAAPRTVVAPAPVMAPAATPQVELVSIAPAPSADTEVQARARVALRQAMGEWQVEPSGAPGEYAALSGAALAPAGMENPAQAKGREAVRQRISELGALQAGMLAYQPIAPPLPAISGSKAGRLAELLSRYRVDLITPEAYHKQRASIVAEP